MGLDELLQRLGDLTIFGRRLPHLFQGDLFGSVPRPTAPELPAAIVKHQVDILIRAVGHDRWRCTHDLTPLPERHPSPSEAEEGVAMARGLTPENPGTRWIAVKAAS